MDQSTRHPTDIFDTYTPESEACEDRTEGNTVPGINMIPGTVVLIYSKLYLLGVGKLAEIGAIDTRHPESCRNCPYVAFLFIDAYTTVSTIFTSIGINNSNISTHHSHSKDEYMRQYCI